MQGFTNNRFINIRKDRFRDTGAKFKTTFVNKFDLGKSLNSINYFDIFFTNYAKSNNQKEFKIIRDLYIKTLNNDNVLNNYIWDELYYKEKVIERLIDIINKFHNANFQVSDITKIFKLKNKFESKIHLYVIINNDVAEILLIDLYHLIIPGDLYSNHRLVKRITFNDLPKKYDKVKDNCYNLSNILEKQLVG